MSLSNLFLLATCYGCYKLGAFNARHPGELAQLARGAWYRLREWLTNSQ